MDELWFWHSLIQADRVESASVSWDVKHWWNIQLLVFLLFLGQLLTYSPTVLQRLITTEHCCCSSGFFSMATSAEAEVSQRSVPSAKQTDWTQRFLVMKQFLMLPVKLFQIHYKRKFVIFNAVNCSFIIQPLLSWNCQKGSNYSICLLDWTEGSSTGVRTK